MGTKEGGKIPPLTRVYHSDILSSEVIKMSVTMNKEILIRMPSSLYNETIKICKKRYVSMSSFIRELIVEQIESALTSAEQKIVVEGERQYSKGKGTNWRKVKRG